MGRVSRDRWLARNANLCKRGFVAETPRISGRAVLPDNDPVTDALVPVHRQVADKQCRYIWIKHLCWKTPPEFRLPTDTGPPT